MGQWRIVLRTATELQPSRSCCRVHLASEAVEAHSRDGLVVWLQVREEMAAMQAQYEAHVTALQEKLEWYANNQRLLTENDELLARQADTISELRKRLEAQPSGKAAAQRIADLNKQECHLLQLF